MSIAETLEASRVCPASSGEFSPLRLGDLSIWPPVILAPMAGVTNSVFRQICRRYGAGLCESEMIAARPLVDANPKTWALATFGPLEHPRSIQLYGVDPDFVARAVERLVAERLVDHIDLNFGCSVPKITRQGGGAALPHRPRLLERILVRAVRAAGTIPVTVKFRLGISDDHLNYIETGRIAEGAGCAAAILHARTAAQYYDGEARWEAIADLKRQVGIPVIGNGDIWEGADAISMMRQTGCDGVAIGRGCLGRPWLFADAARLFDGARPTSPPRFGEVVDLMLDHLSQLVESVGEERAIPAFRRQATWYTKGFRGSTKLREALVSAKSFEGLRHLLSTVDRDLEFPPNVLRVPRGKSSGQKSVSLPQGYLDNPESVPLPADDVWAEGG